MGYFNSLGRVGEAAAGAWCAQNAGYLAAAGAAQVAERDANQATWEAAGMRLALHTAESDAAVLAEAGFASRYLQTAQQMGERATRTY